MTISLVTFSQSSGITFYNDTVFGNVLQKAKVENKLIFIDCYAVWCGPCKFMSNNIFIDEEVGKFHNANFINLKYDMEQPYGIIIKKKYQVKGYPTYLYLDSNGEVIHRGIGSTPDAETFLELSRTATNSDKNFRAICQKINQGDRTALTISEYLNLNYRAANTDSLINDHFNLTGYNEKFSPETWKLFQEHLNNPESPAFDFFLKNRQKYVDKFGKKTVDDKLMESFSAVYRSSPEKYEQLKSVDSILFKTHKRMVRFSMANSKFLKDKTDRENWKEMIESASDFIQNSEVKPNQLNSVAWTICENYKTFKDKTALKKALDWSKSCLADEPENPSFIDTYAHLLFEKGDKKNAVIYQERAIRIARDQKSPDLKELEEGLKKFQGKK